jgi:threonine/homoserine/homoserine lactone efflux protein
MSLAGLGTAFGFRPSLSYLLGIIAGTTVVLLMIATGVTALVLAQPILLTALTILGGIYILYLAWKIASAPVGPLVPRSEHAPAFVPGFSLAIANPKAFAAIGAVYAGHTLVADNVTADAVYKLAALVLVIVIVNTVWLAFGATFSMMLTNPAVGRAANVLFAIMLVTSVGFALLDLS